MSYDAILFDLDNTLYDYDAYWAERLRWSLAPVLLRYPHLQLESLVEQAIAGQIYLREWRAFLMRVGVTAEEVLVAAQERYQVNRFEDLSLYPGARQLLAALRSRYRLGLITNGPAFTQRPKIARFGLAELMDVILISEEVGVAKPDPAIFRMALAQLGVAPERAVFVGDSPDHDLRGACAAGLHAIWMNPRRLAAPPDLPPLLATIASLADLAPIFNVTSWGDAVI
jgi:putative hydrolase of the HAD superfamily